ncbi:MAG: RDD family protein [Acholeplasmataceae bacterium]
MNELGENIDLIAKQEYETATFIRRGFSYLLDVLVVIAILTAFIYGFKVFDDINKFFELFEATAEDLENEVLYLEMRDLFLEVLLKVYLFYLASKLIYFTLIPAIIGNGRTLGKLVAGLAVLDEGTLEEISPSRLILREFLGRVLIETVLIIPFIISIFISYYREDSKSLHDLIAKTVVIKEEMFEITKY